MTAVDSVDTETSSLGQLGSKTRTLNAMAVTNEAPFSDA